MDSILTLLAPPFLGAFIGYLTNYVAIRMLFRPLRPWRLLGVRVPMTPGVIPSKRGLLAENIGKMVGRHLLTSADVHKALAEKGFQRQLQVLVDERLDSLIHRELGPPTSLIPEQFRGYFATGLKILKWRFSKHLQIFLDSESFGRSVSQALDQRGQEILAADLGHFLTESTRNQASDAAGSAAGRLFASRWFEEQIREFLAGRFAAAVAEQRTLADLLPTALVQMLLDKVDNETPNLLARLAGYLEEPAMQERIAQAVSGSLLSFVGSLGPLAAMLGSFVHPEVVDQKIRNYLADHRGDFTRWQTDEALQRKVAALLRAKIERFLATPLSVLLSSMDPDKVTSVQEGLAAQIVRLLRRPETARFLGDLLRQALDRQADQPLREALAGLAGADGLERARGWATGEVVSLLRSTGSRRLLEQMFADLLEHQVMTRPIGSLSDFLPKAVQEGVRDYLLAQIGELLIREVPNLVETLNVEQMVARKVNSLDLLKLEGLLLGIMQEQFKYINLFGAGLGFLIGSLNLLLLLGR